MSPEHSLTLLFDKDISDAKFVPYLVVHVLIAISNITVNTFLLHALNKLKKTSNISFLFVKFLSISDLSVGISQIIYLFCRCFIRSYTPEMLITVEFTVQTIFYVTAPFSGGMILTIAVDRYIHMKYLTKYNIIMTRKRAWILIFMNFLFQIATAVSLLLASFHGYFAKEQPILVAAYLIMFGGAVFLYQGAFRSIRTRTRNSSVGIEPLATGTRVSERRNPSYDFLKTMMYVLISLVICYLPFLTLTTTRSVIVLCKRDVPYSLMYGLLWTYNLNFLLSTLNPVIFITYNKDIRSYAMQRMYRARRHRRSSQWEEFSMANIESNVTEINIRRLTVASSPW